MRREKVLWTTLIVVGCVVALIAGYVFWQYRTARPPALNSMPIYTSAVPVADIIEPQRTDAEAQLRNLASSAKPGYKIADERFLATNVEFIWDALRHRVEPFLKSAGYALNGDGWSSDYMVVYHVYRHDGRLRRWFNDDMILVAGLDRTTMRTATGEQVHLYGYFRLTRS